MQVFDSERSAMAAVLAGSVVKGDAVIVRCVPKLRRAELPMAANQAKRSQFVTPFRSKSVATTNTKVILKW